MASAALADPARDDGALFRRWKRDRDPADHEALAARFLPLAQHLALRYRTGGERDDLMQVAALGLVKAIDRFDPDRGVAFTSFAVPTILGELRRYFRDHGWSVRVPRDLQELGRRCVEARDELTARLGRSPTANQLAEACETTTERVLEALAAGLGHYAASLNDPRHAEDEDDGLSHLAVEETGFDRVDSALDLRGALAPLPTRDRQVMLLRYEHDLTQQEIGDALGMSQMQVSRTLARCARQLSVTDGSVRPSPTAAS